MMMLTLRGVPCLYYGEELGMADAPPADTRLDIDGRDGARVPMYWDDRGTGFSSGQPWLPGGPDQAEANVARQDGEKDSLLNLYRRLIWYRRGSRALRGGDYRSLDPPEASSAFLCWAPWER